MRKNGTWPKTKIIQTNIPFIYLDEEKQGLVKNQNNTKNILLFIQAQGKVRKNGAWPKTKIIQRTSFYLLDYNCNLQSNWIIKK